MRESTRRQRIALVLGMAVVSFVLLTACDDVATTNEMAEDFFDDFDSGRESDDRNADATSRTGDEAVDGILDSLDTVNDIQKAEEHYQPIRADIRNGTNQQYVAAHLDEAIALRPDDLRYRLDRARVALRGNDPGLAVVQWREMDRIAIEQGYDHQYWYWDGSFVNAGTALADLIGPGLGVNPLNYSDADDRRAVAIYTRLADCLDRMAAINTENLELEQAARQMDMAEEYRQKVKDHGG